MPSRDVTRTSGVVAEVVVDVRNRALDQTFDYSVPLPWHERIAVGQRVYVPFGNQHRLGYVVALKETADVSQQGRIKPISSLMDEDPLLIPSLLEVVDFLRYRYACTRVEALEAVLPAAFRVDSVKKFQIVEAPPSDTTLEMKELCRYLLQAPRTMNELTRHFGQDVMWSLEQCLTAGYVQEIRDLKDRIRARLETYVKTDLTVDTLREEALNLRQKAPKQAYILEQLAAQSPLPLAELSIRPSDGAIKALLRKGFIALAEQEVYREVVGMSTASMSVPEVLTHAQERAIAAIIQAIAADEYREMVLYGVTGSGKSEVYLQAIAACLEKGYGAIFLVPEIALTPQMVSRFQARFKDLVAVLHSGLSAGEKRDEWLRIHRKEARVVVGARSAVFAPVDNLRCIIIDEEHEPSYKQEDSPRYDAREVALWRIQRVGGVCVLGSATPSLQMMHRVESGLAQLLSMPLRANGRPLPAVEIVDMREELRHGNRTLFSRALITGIKEAIAAREQVILFLNRRGYAGFVLCRNCGETVVCPRCDISLTLHKSAAGDWLHCHYCDHRQPAVTVCPHCQEEAMRPFGVGTQQVEQALMEIDPAWRIVRMDVDTTRRKGAHQEAIETFQLGQADILLGTQMIAKGLDFANVTFVGVIAADTMLSVPDYRSAERTFSLLTQVAGRAGRAERTGHTIIQTYRPTHYAIVAASNHDYGNFYRQERELREAFAYPPFQELTVFTAIHKKEKFAESAARRFEREMKRQQREDMIVLPAVRAGIGRIDEQFRYQVVVKYSRWDVVRSSIVEAFDIVDKKMRSLKGICILDVNAARV